MKNSLIPKYVVYTTHFWYTQGPRNGFYFGKAPKKILILKFHMAKKVTSLTGQI